MNSRKANWAFLATLICYMAVAFGIGMVFPTVTDSLFLNNLLVELVVLLPVIIFAAASGEKLSSFLGFHRIKISSVLMVIVFSLLTMPALSLFNLISQLWVKNEVAIMMENFSASQVNVWVLWLSMAIVAPLCEETTCRGAYYRAYGKSGSAFRAMILSALVFALLHMNFNQAAYAFVMGILAVLLVEVTGSLWSSVLYHGVVNGSQVLLMYEAFKMDPDVYSGQLDLITSDFLFYGISVYLILTAVTLPLAWAVLVWLGAKEGRSGVLSQIWKGRKEKKDKMITVPLVLALILCLGMMTGAFSQVIVRLMK